MKALTHLAVVIAALVPHAEHKPKPRPKHRLHRHGPRLTLNSTAYSACDSGTQTADGGRAYFGEVAVVNGTLPLGTRLRMIRPPFVHGRKFFTVHDHIGSGSQLDFFMPCGWVNAWGRRDVVVEVVR